MLCPICETNDDKVIDSRSTEGGSAIRRRRVCLSCKRRFTTKERIEREIYIDMAIIIDPLGKVTAVLRDKTTQAVSRSRDSQGPGEPGE